MIKKEELKENDFVLYVSQFKLDKEGSPIISLSGARILKLYDDTFDSKYKKGLKRYLILKVSGNDKFEEYEEYDEPRIYEEFKEGVTK